MFERVRHQQIAALLASLDAALLRSCNCWFGGGTAVVLRYGEYRESLDVDFLVSDKRGYRQLRRHLTGRAGFGAILREGHGLVRQLREIRADRYGIRTRLGLADAAFKFEIVFEARIDLDVPGDDDEIGGVAALTPNDMAATKLLANADRWADDGAFNRDLIDLAMIEMPAAGLRAACRKAQQVYGEDVLRYLERSIARLRDREGWLQRCAEQLQIELPAALIWQRVRRLQRRLLSDGFERSG
jgi:hypothetical protein